MNIGQRLQIVFRESLLGFKKAPREGIAIALYLVWGIWASLAIPYFGGILASLVFVSAYHFILTGGSQDRGLIGFGKFLVNLKNWKTAPLIIFIFPSVVLIGTAQALAFTPSENPSLIFLGSFSLGWLTLIYLTIVLRAVPLVIRNSQHVFVAADSALRHGFSHFKEAGIFSFYAAVMFVIGLLPMGLGLIFALPLFFLALQEFHKDEKKPTA